MKKGCLKILKEQHKSLFWLPRKYNIQGSLRLNISGNNPNRLSRVKCKRLKDFCLWNVAKVYEYYISYRFWSFPVIHYGLEFLVWWDLWHNIHTEQQISLTYRQNSLNTSIWPISYILYNRNWHESPWKSGWFCSEID